MSRRSKKNSLPEDRNRRRQQNPASNTPSSFNATGDSGGPSTLWTVVEFAGRRDWLIAAALVVAVFLAYQPAWQGGFVWDDDLHLLNNPVLKPEGLITTWIPGANVNYWPLTSTVYRLEYEMWGLNPLGYHLVNIALHAISSLLVWRMLKQLQIPGAMLAAAIFALHPVNVESVAWITQLKNVLSLPLAILSVLFFLRYERDGKPLQFTMSLGMFLLSALSKGMTLTLPVVLLACVWWQRGCIRRRDVLRILPYLIIAALMVGMEMKMQHVWEENAPPRADGFLGRTAVAGCAVWFYFWKFLWPTNLMFVYPRWSINERDLLSYVPGMLLAIILALAWWRRHSWGRPVMMLMVCYVALLLPVLGFANILFMEFSLVADHWQYAAIIAPCALLAGMIVALGRRLSWSRSGDYTFILGLLTILTVLTFQQSRMYTDVETLYRTTIERNPGCWLAHNNLGVLLTDRGQIDEAIEHFQDAGKANPGNVEAHYDLGVALARRGRIEEAITQYREALKIKRNYVNAHCNLGIALASQGKIEEAISHYYEALKIKPNDSPTLNNLAWLLATCSKSAFRDGAEAVKLAERAFQLSDGRDPNVLDTLAAAYAEAKRFPEAVQTVSKAIELAKQQNKKALAERLNARMRLYEARTPYRDNSSP